jgi:hypothetical protein
VRPLEFPRGFFIRRKRRITREIHFTGKISRKRRAPTFSIVRYPFSILRLYEALIVLLRRLEGGTTLVQRRLPRLERTTDVYSREDKV